MWFLHNHTYLYTRSILNTPDAIYILHIHSSEFLVCLIACFYHVLIKLTRHKFYVYLYKCAMSEEAVLFPPYTSSHSLSLILLHTHSAPWIHCTKSVCLPLLPSWWILRELLVVPPSTHTPTATTNRQTHFKLSFWKL